MTSYAQIGKGEAVHAAPALRRSIAEIVAEYDAKADAIPEAIAIFEAAETAINVAGCIGGTFGGQIFSRPPSLYERDVRAALLKSAWKHIREGLRIEDIASAKDRKQIELRLETPRPSPSRRSATCSGTT